ncbi:ParB/RepB/Spo0J family partition protein [Candidatus Saccharibacteria bacterium]|nr:ParB/RepB/Spo0J family partition protein [Candidatus Saccharibacteria bacterium]
MKRGLGKGFDSLISSEIIANEFDVTANTEEKVSDLRSLNIGDIEPNPDQPRREFDEAALSLLASSIKKHGLMQPIVVTVKAGGKYQIVAGERRYRASKIAGLKTIKAVVRTVSGQQKLELALIENLHREDLNPLETATAYLKLKEQFNMSLDDIAQEMRGQKATSSISNTLRLLQLPDFAKTALSKGEISEGHARQVLALAGDGVAQKNLVEKIIKEGMSVREAERFVVAAKREDSKKPQIKQAAKITTTDFTRELSNKLGLPVSQTISTKKGGGRIIIEFKNAEELSALEEKLGQLNSRAQV